MHRLYAAFQRGASSSAPQAALNKTLRASSPAPGAPGSLPSAMGCCGMGGMLRGSNHPPELLEGL